MDFTGKNILVVGGSSGIGLSVVNSLLLKEATVYNISRHASNQWAAPVNHLDLDILTDVSALSGFLPQQLHGLVYSVGSINLKPFNRLTEDDFLNDFRINVLGAVKVLQQTLKPLKSSGAASVVLISTVAAKTGMGFHTSVAAAKSGVEGLALSLAAEFAAQNIRVNVVAPSLTDTPLAKTLLSTPERQEASAKRHPMGKYGQPEDVAAAIIFLLSVDSSWVTGQIVGVDGGLGNLKTS